MKLYIKEFYKEEKIKVAYVGNKCFFYKGEWTPSTPLLFFQGIIAVGPYQTDAHWTTNLGLKYTCEKEHKDKVLDVIRKAKRNHETIHYTLLR
mgnify:CR=1 FL=1